MTSIGIGALGEPVLADLLEPLFGGPLSHGISVAISVTVAYLLITSAHIVAGEIVPKLYVIDKAEGVARRAGAAAALLPPALHAVHRRPHGDQRPDPARARRRPRPDRARRAARPRSSRRSSPSRYTGGKLDPGEAGMLPGVFHLHEQEARQVMTPIPAVVTVDISEDVETALRRCISSGHTRLLVTEDDNQDRVRGIVHSNSLARQAHGRGPQRVDRGPGQGRPHRARDQAAGRPARRPAAPPLLDGGGHRRVRPRSRDRHGRGHHRGGRRRDRRRDRSRRAARSAAWPTATGSCAATSRSPISSTTG